MCECCSTFLGYQEEVDALRDRLAELESNMLILKSERDDLVDESLALSQRIVLMQQHEDLLFATEKRYDKAKDVIMYLLDGE